MIIVNDLEKNLELDHAALAGVAGGHGYRYKNKRYYKKYRSYYFKKIRYFNYFEGYYGSRKKHYYTPKFDYGYGCGFPW